ncbi:MAG TPA: hypothetical protein VN085_13395 [Vicinamibacterales bacterium]|jgi:hypothetical protein|nr:hypothetical protein [Vicinamibacterales bacterium]
MARGWESKNIESQQEEAQRRRSTGAALTPEERDKEARRRSLELARTRAAADLERATAPAHRKMLEQALDALDQQIGELR